MDERGLREGFLARIKEAKPAYKEGFIPGIGKVFIKRLNAGERDAYERFGSINHERAAILLHFLFDDRGIRIFQDSDYEELKLSDPADIDHITSAALKFNNYTKAEQEELLKNLNGQAVVS